MKRAMLVALATLAFGGACGYVPADVATEDPFPNISRADEDALFAQVAQDVTSCTHGWRMMKLALDEPVKDEINELIGTALVMRLDALGCVEG